MNRRLIIMRHAKSAGDSPSQGDHDRPLNSRGRRSAPLVAAKLAELDWSPTIVHSSDAARTVETWRGMESTFDHEISVTFARPLYLAGLSEIRDASAEWGDSPGPVLVLGHNPGWADAVGSLTGAYASMTTANAALLEGAGETWSAALRGPWTLVAMIEPRELEAE